MRAFASFLRLIDTISDRVGKIVAWFTLALVAMLVYAVIMRYAFNNSPEWAHETSLFMYGGICMFAGAYVLYHRGHIRMDLFYERLSPRGKAIMDSITAPFFFLFVVFLIWFGWELALWAIKTGKTTDSMWHPILWPVKLAIPIGGFLLLVQGIADFIRNLYFAIRGRSIE